MNLTDYTRETLRGLTGVIVVTENLREDAEAAGLSAAELQTDVELKLSGAGIHVLTQEEWRGTQGRPWLYVSVNTIRYLGSHFFSIDVQLKQDVALAAKPAVITSSATWEVGSIGFANSRMLSEKVRGSVSSSVDKFISDFVIANAH